MNVGLNHYWNCDENTGTNVEDERGGYIGFQKNGTIVTGGGWTTGILGSACSSDGSSNGGAFEITGFPNPAIANNTWALSFWTYETADTDGSNGYFGSNDDGQNRAMPYAIADGRVAWVLNGGATFYATGARPALNGWHHHIYMLNSTDLVIYVDGIFKAGVGNRNPSNPFQNLRFGGLNAGGYKGITGKIDEVGFWNRSLTDSEILDLYNGGSGISYTDIFGGVSVVQLEPEDELITTSTSNFFSANITTTSSTVFDNSTIKIFNSSTDLVYENTTILSGNGTQNVNWTITLAEGFYNWSVDVYGDTGAEYAYSGNRTLTIDLTSPVVTILYPTNATGFVTTSIPYNLTINNSISDNLGLSSCWYYNGTGNTTLTCGNNITEGFNAGWSEVIIYANDTANNLGEDRVSFFVNYLQENASYINPAIEGETYNFNITLNATSLTSLTGSLTYNGTVYNASSSVDGNIGILSSNIAMSNVSSNEIRSFFWNFTLNGNNYTSSTYNHTVYFINPINVSVSCSAGLSPAMCFDFKNEQNLTSLDAEIDYNFQFGISNSSYKTIYGSLGNSSNFCLCINSTVYNDYILGEGEIQYSKTGYADRRFYTFSTQRLSNVTINNTLYLLASGSATSFLFDFKDTNLAPYVNRYTTLLRWYSNLNEYKVVEMAKTDDKGETIMRVQTEDVDYRVGLYERNGSLIDLLNPVRFACISAPCSYSSLVDSADRDYTSFFNVEGSIEFNETTNIWTLTWNDPSQNTDSMNLVVTRERGDSSYTICDVSASGFTGVLICDSTGYTGTLIATAYRTASPATPIFQKIINTLSSPFAGSVGLFISFILVALLMLIGVYSPVASVILGIIALLPALYMGVITLAIFIAIAVLGGIIIHFMKRTG